MPSFHHGLITRSSSATLSASLPQDNVLDGTFEDMVIAQELLNQPKALRRQVSLAGLFSNSLELQVPRNQSEYDGSNEEKRSRRELQSSNTWTSSSGGDILSDHDDIEDRTLFVAEYNRLAQKHGIRAIVPEDHDVNDDTFNVSAKSSWFTRKVLRRTSSNQSAKPEKHIKHRRSISDLSLRLKYAKKDTLKDKDLQELVRLCGSSLLYLPAEYAPGSLAVPTCFRATAQYLVQHAPSARGIFRIPGSHSVVAALYAHYCNKDFDGEIISGTVHCPSIPGHIKCDVHDVASAFKKFLSGLPGGILGSLALFDALVAIQSQLQGDPELTRTKQTKVRARLIALAISTSRSQYRRDLICAVFGLLCMVGRAAETTRRENERGRPLPTSDLMGYTALGIIFGPLLVGELLENSSMHLANPHGGLVLLPFSPPKSRKEKHKKRSSIDEGIYFNTHVDKIKVANSITEMVITHWRDVVRHIKNIGASRVIGGHKSVGFKIPKPPFLRPSASDTFSLRKPPDWDDSKPPIRRMERSDSPTPIRRVSVTISNNTESRHGSNTESPHDSLVVRKQRSRPCPKSSQILSGQKIMGALSPTAEERLSEKSVESPEKHARWTENKFNPVSSTAIESIISLLPPPSPPFPLSKTPPAYNERIKENSSFRNPEKPVGSAQSDSSHHKKGKLTKSPKSLTKQHKEHSKSSEKSSESLGVIIRNQMTASARKVVGKSVETPVKTVEHSHLAQNTQRGHDDYFHSPTGQSAKPPKPPSSNLQPQHSDTRVSKDTVVVPEGTVSARIKRFAASEPGQTPSGLQIPNVRRLSKTTYGDTTRNNWASPQHLVNKDPLSSISHVEDEASLAALARAMESEETSTKVNESPAEKNHHSKHEQEDNCASEATVAQTMQSEGKSTSKKDAASHISHEQQVSSSSTPALTYSESSTGSGDPFNVQTTSSSIPTAIQTPTGPPTSSFLMPMTMADNSKAPVCPILGSQMPSDDPDPSTSSPSKIPRAHRNVLSRPAIRSRGSSVKALAAKFNKPESPPTIISSPAKSLAKSTISNTPSNQSPRRNSMVAQYMRNTTSPGKSHKSARSDNTPVSIPTVQAQKHIQFGCKQIVETRSSPAKNSSPRRILKTSIHDSTPLRRVDRSFESISRTSSFTVNATNPFAVPLKSVTPAPQADGPQDGLYDGSSSTSMIGGSHIASGGPPEAQHADPSQRTRRGEPSSEDLHPEPLNITRSVSGRPLRSQRAQASWLTSTHSSTPSIGEYLDMPESPSDQQYARSASQIPSQAIGATQDSPLQHPESLEQVLSITSQLLENDPILSHYNPRLHPQSMTLQGHVSRKNEKSHQLKQQLISRDSVDVDTLSKELKNTKKELRTWKKRAEAAERKLEQLYEALGDSRPNSDRPLIGILPSMLQFSDDYDDPSKGSERICNVMHGMDGAGGSGEKSEESNGTVIRERKDSESEYIALWDQTMNGLSHQEPE